MSEISELKKTCEEKKGVPTSADTRLITPYTIYLLRKFEWQNQKWRKKVSTLTDWRNCEKIGVSFTKK